MNSLKMTLVFILGVLGIVAVGTAIKSQMGVVSYSSKKQSAKIKMKLPMQSWAKSEQFSEVVEEEFKNQVVGSLPNIHESKPADQILKDEVQDDAHKVPSSLTDFSVVVANKMKQAKTNVVFAEALFVEFKDCAEARFLNSEKNITVRAYCLANAKRLANWFPNLQSRWEALSLRMEYKVIELLDLTQG